MEKPQHILFEESNGFGFIYMNRPEVHNAIDSLMISELIRLFSEIADDDSIRAVIIAGKGKSFSSGADLNYMQSMVFSTRPDNLEDAGKLAALFDSIYNCPLPVISVAHGNVSGGAIGIIAASDIVLCAENTRFRFTELKIGLVPATISPYIIRRLGEALAAELLFTGRSFTGAQAYSYGLVNKSVNENELDSELKLLLEEISTSGPVALRKTKLLIREVAGKDIDMEMKRFTSRLIAEVRVSPEAREGMQAFLEKRKPRWSK
jgi:methylglutaconyl-CoA hydratase